MKTLTLSPKRPAKGFTLLELMVAMAITTIIVTILVSITGVATDTWTRSRSETRAARQAKVLLDTMSKDFESFVSRRGQDTEWLVAEMDSDANLPQVAREGNPPEVAQLIFFTAATDRYFGQIGTAEDAGGDVSCVSYRMDYQDPIEGSGGTDRTKTFVVYRKLVDPDDTFKDLLGQEDLKSAFSSYSSEVKDEENFICENIVQFTITFLVEVTRTASGGTGSTVETARVTMDSNSSGDFKLNGSTGIETQLSPSSTGVTADDIKGGRLTGVELSVSVISDAGLARLSAGGSGLTEKDYARNVYHYSRTVELPGM